MKYKSEILALLNRAGEEVSEIIHIYERTSDYRQVSKKIYDALSLLRDTDTLLIRHHLEKCVPQLLAQRKTDEGIKQIVLSYKYLHKGGI